MQNERYKYITWRIARCPNLKYYTMTMFVILLFVIRAGGEKKTIMARIVLSRALVPQLGLNSAISRKLRAQPWLLLCFHNPKAYAGNKSQLCRKAGSSSAVIISL